MTAYANYLTVRQAFPTPDFTISDFFPLVGDTVTLTNISDDDDSILWTLRDGTNVTNPTIDINNIVITTDDILEQNLQVTNTVATLDKTKFIYSIPVPNEAYYDYTLDRDLIRQGETVTITPRDIYSSGLPVTLQLILTETDTDVEFFNQTITGATPITFPDRGDYTINLIATTTANGFVSDYMQERAIVVTPALAPRVNAVEHVIVSTEDSDNGFFDIFDGSGVAPGSTVVLSKDPAAAPGSIFRIRIQNIVGTAQDPIVVTVDESTPLELNFQSFNGLLLSACEHIVVDGRGYQDLQYGIHIFKDPSVDIGTTAVQVTNLGTDAELFGLELSNTSFAGIQSKTDPNPNNPEAWRGTFTYFNFRVHHNFIHDIDAEGMYIGYFSNSNTTGTNSSGQQVTYRAHDFRDGKVFRNIVQNCGWDGIQFNNGTGNCEIAYNTVTNVATLGEPDQNTGFSLTIEGSIHNNVISGVNGLGIQTGATGPLDIYNNTINNIASGSNILFLTSSTAVPEQNVNGTQINQIPIRIFNNTLIGNGRSSLVGAQNVCQYQGLVLFNNFADYQGAFLGGQSTDTTNIVEANSTNNIQFNEADLNLYRIGSIEDGEFNIHPLSTLANGGTLEGTNYDIRGFRNWYGDSKFIGAYASIVALDANTLILSDFTIDEGDTVTSADINVTFTYTGVATEFQVSEDPAFTGAVWMPISGPRTFTLSGAPGLKTVYGRLRNTAVTTGSESDTTTLITDLNYLINVSNDNPVRDAPVPPWNNLNINSDLTSGGSVANILSTGSVASTITATMTDPIDGFESNFFNYDTGSEPYDTDGVAFKIRVNRPEDGGVGEADILLTGFNPVKLYDIVLFAYRFAAGEQILGINGSEQIYDSGDPSSVAVFPNVDISSGTVTVTVKTTTNSHPTFGAMLSLIEIVERDN